MKNEIPSGSGIPGRPSGGSPTQARAASRFAAAKSVYLNTVRSPRLPATAATSQRRRPRASAASPMRAPNTKLKPIDASTIPA